MLGLRFIPLAFVALSLLPLSSGLLSWLIDDDDALSCQVGGHFEIHNKTAFPNAKNSTLVQFLHDMDVFQRFPLLDPKLLSFANSTSQDCGSLPYFKGQNVQEFACAEARFCHADVTAVVKGCFPRRPLEECLKKKTPGRSLTVDFEKGWAIEACGCTTSDCNRNWEKLEGICWFPNSKSFNKTSGGTYTFSAPLTNTPPILFYPIQRTPAPKAIFSAKKVEASLTCQVGGILEIRNRSSKYANMTLSAFLGSMGITKRVPGLPKFDHAFFTNQTSKACGQLPGGFACAELRVCHQDLRALAKFCMPLSTNWPKADRNLTISNLPFSKSLRVKLSTCASSDCNQGWKKLLDADCSNSQKKPTGRGPVRARSASSHEGFPSIRVAALSALVVLFSLL